MSELDNWEWNLMRAASQNDVSAIEDLNKKVDISSEIRSILIGAVRSDSLDVVQYLLPLSKTRYVNEAFIHAVDFKNKRMVDFLLPYFEPKFNKNEGLRTAIATGDSYFIDLLYPISNPKNALQEFLNSEGPRENYTTLLNIMEEKKAQETKSKILSKIEKIRSTHSDKPRTKSVSKI